MNAVKAAQVSRRNQRGYIVSLRACYVRTMTLFGEKKNCFCIKVDMLSEWQVPVVSALGTLGAGEYSNHFKSWYPWYSRVLSRSSSWYHQDSRGLSCLPAPRTLGTREDSVIPSRTGRTGYILLTSKLLELASQWYYSSPGDWYRYFDNLRLLSTVAADIVQSTTLDSARKSLATLGASR